MVRRKSKGKSLNCKKQSRIELNHVRKWLSRKDVSRHRINGVVLLGSENRGDLRVRRDLGHSRGSRRSGKLHRGGRHLGRHGSLMLNFSLGLCHGRHGQRPGVAAFAATLRCIFHLEMCVTLDIVSQGPSWWVSPTYLVRVSEPGGSLLLAADKGNPLLAATTETLPNIRVSIHASLLLGFLERTSGGGANAVRERLVIPEGRVLQHEPSSRLADSTPALSLVAVTSNPSRGVKVAFKSQLLLAGDHIGILGVHVLRRWRDLLFSESRVQLRRVRKVGVVTVEASGISVALKHSEKTVRQKWLRRGEMVDVGLPRLLLGHLRWKLSRKQHAVSLVDGGAGNNERCLLHGLEVAIVERQRSGTDGRRRVAGVHVLVAVVDIRASMVNVLGRLAGRRGVVSTSRPSLESWPLDAVGSRSNIAGSRRRRSTAATTLSPHKVGPRLRSHSRRGNGRKLGGRHHGSAVRRRWIVRAEGRRLRERCREIIERHVGEGSRSGHRKGRTGHSTLF